MQRNRWRVECFCYPFSQNKITIFNQKIYQLGNCVVWIVLGIISKRPGWIEWSFGYLSFANMKRSSVTVHRILRNWFHFLAKLLEFTSQRLMNELKNACENIQFSCRKDFFPRERPPRNPNRELSFIRSALAKDEIRRLRAANLTKFDAWRCRLTPLSTIMFMCCR